MDTIQLNHGITMPQQGLGVFQVTDQSVCKESVLTALQTYDALAHELLEHNQFAVTRVERKE